MSELTIYPVAVKQLIETIQEQQMAHLDADTAAVVVYLESGRKFDRVMIAEHKHGKPRTEAKARYFICKKRGNIYGALSPQAPNFKWYFGDLSTIKKWDWSGFHARPMVSARDAGVVFVGKYGAYDHYEKISSRRLVLCA